MTREPFFPQAVYSISATKNADPPRVLIAPARYVQGPGTLHLLGRYITLVPGYRPLILITEGGRKRFGERIEASLSGESIHSCIEIFGGECSVEEVERIVEKVRGFDSAIDSVIAVGGGKCIDAGKSIAFRLRVPSVICPTIASTDAPCSAGSILYTPEGVGKGPEFFPDNPALVVVDTAIIAASPLRHFVAGMGDALATTYEARTCYRNPRGRSIVGARMTIAALAIAELCAKTLFNDAMDAIEAVGLGEITDSVERVVEANTLLSGIGFESCGLAAAHAIAAGLTVIPVLHRDYLHGELVAIGLVAQLLMEDNPADAEDAVRFMNGVGLPVCLKQFRLDPSSETESIKKAMIAAASEPIAGNEPFEVTPEKFYDALMHADRFGEDMVLEHGMASFLRIHTGGDRLFHGQPDYQ
ncbi:MAG: glycerol dehydrogenase [Acidobacteriota bacterium]